MIISGGAKGADSLAARYAKAHGIPLQEYRPDWKRYGRCAWPFRNTTIIVNSDVVVAFWDYQSSGTRDSIEKAKALDKKLYIIAISKEADDKTETH
jgi:hypothetical protein